MIVPDVNLLLYAYNREAPLHNEARNWWVGLINGTERVGIPWAVANSFLRLLTIRGLLTHPATPSQALDFVREWFRQPHVAPLNPGSQHLTLLSQVACRCRRGRQPGHWTPTSPPWPWSTRRRSTPTTRTSAAFQASAGATPYDESTWAQARESAAPPFVPSLKGPSPSATMRPHSNRSRPF